MKKHNNIKKGGKMIILEESSSDDDTESMSFSVPIQKQVQSSLDHRNMMNTDNRIGDIFKQDDFILCKNENGDIVSCGFNIQSLLLKQGISPMSSIFHVDDRENQIMGDDDNVDVVKIQIMNNDKSGSIHQTSSVPPGLCVINEKLPQLCKHTYIEEEEDISDDIIDRLLELASVNEKQKRKTQKRNPMSIVMVAGTNNKRKSRKYIKK